MITLLLAEARKTASTRSSIAIMAVAVVYGPAAVALAALAPAPQRPELDRDTILQILRGVADFAAPAALMLGILATAGEYRHGTIVPVLLAEPRRHRVLAAKLLFQATVGAAVGATGSALALAAGAAYLDSHSVELGRPLEDVVVTASGVTVVAALYGALGAGLGAVVGNQTAAVTAALAWTLALEEAVPILLRAPGLRRWLPDGATTRLLHLVDPASDMTGLWTAAGIFAAAFGLLAIPAAVRTSRRDIP